MCVYIYVDVCLSVCMYVCIYRERDSARARERPVQRRVRQVSQVSAPRHLTGGWCLQERADCCSLLAPDCYIYIYIYIHIHTYIYIMQLCIHIYL